MKLSETCLDFWPFYYWVLPLTKFWWADHNSHNCPAKNKQKWPSMQAEGMPSLSTILGFWGHMKLSAACLYFWLFYCWVLPLTKFWWADHNSHNCPAKTNKIHQPRKQKACHGWAQSGVFEGTWSSVQHVYIFDCFIVKCFHWPSSGEQTTTATTAQLKTNKNEQACKQKACQVWAQSGVFEGTWSSVQHVYIFDCFIVKCFHWPSSDEQTTTATAAQLKQTKFTNHASRRHAKVELNLGFLRAHEAQWNMLRFLTVLLLSASTDEVLVSRPQQPQLPS